MTIPIFMTRKFFRFAAFILIVSQLILSCKTARNVSGTYVSQSRQDYIVKYKDWAIDEMNRTGIPASITLGQGILESGDGNSRLAREANNHFGIKCHDDWKGKTVRHDDDKRKECFRKYDSVKDSYRDHSDFLKGKQRYAFLFDLKPTDYKGWAKGLKKAGYATHHDYSGMLIKIIEENRLYIYDKENKYAEAEVNDSSQATVNIKAAGDAGSGVEGAAVVGMDQALPDGRQEFSGDFHMSAGGREIRSINRVEYIIAKKGDSFASLTKELEKISWELPKYNEMSKTAVLTAGQTIYLQPKRKQAEKGFDFHIVKEGETIWWISQLYAIRKSSLLKYNNIKEGEEPMAGAKIILRKGLN